MPLDPYRASDRRGNRRRSDFAGLTLVTAPATEPVTAIEVKAFMRVTTADEDTLINTLISAGRQACENYLKRSLVSQSWKLTIDRDLGDDDIIILPRPPLLTVESVKYRDESDVLQTLATSEYEVDTSTDPGRVIFDDIPDTSLEFRPRWEINYTAGYVTIPPAIKLAILNYVSHYFEYRVPSITGTIVSTVPDHLTSLIDDYRCYRL